MSIVSNFDELATTEPRRTALEIIDAGIARVLPESLVRSAVSWDEKKKLLSVLGDKFLVCCGRIFVIGGGKASGRMAAALEEIIGPDHIVEGVVSVKGDPPATQKIRLISAGHPVPDERGERAVREIRAIKEKHRVEDVDLIICLVSGGGSALLPLPAEGVTLADKQSVTNLLLGSGADISEINTVRKHLSAVKGGRLGAHFAPARLLSLVISDVIGNNLFTIASGPTVPDPTSYADALAVLERYGLAGSVPPRVKTLLEKGCRGECEETPKVPVGGRNIIIGDNALALRAMEEKAAELGLHPLVITSEQEGDASEVASLRAQEVRDGIYAGYDCLIIGGETTVSLPENAGKGGRNQHYAAATMREMADYPGEWTLASVGTDGTDYLPDTAGAIVDRSSLESARAKGLDIDSFLSRCDSNTLLKETGNSLVVTGDTGTNVCDVAVYLLK